VRKRLRHKAILSVVIGVLLGVAVAWLALRFASMIQPPPSE
jgi:acid phosphatase family membrane protein YuiD